MDTTNQPPGSSTRKELGLLQVPTMLITESYRALNQELHQKDLNWGASHPAIVELVAGVIKLTQAKSVLDYGAGKQLIRQRFGPIVRSYDPAIPGIDRTPDPADLVVCLSVLEHIEPECLDAVLNDIKRCTIKATLLVVSCFPSGKILSDGRNAHLIQENMDWWLPHLMKRWSVNTAMLMPGRFWFLGRPK